MCREAAAREIVTVFIFYFCEIFFPRYTHTLSTFNYDSRGTRIRFDMQYRGRRKFSRLNSYQ